MTTLAGDVTGPTPAFDFDRARHVTAVRHADEEVSDVIRTLQRTVERLSGVGEVAAAQRLHTATNAVRGAAQLISLRREQVSR